MKISNTEYAKSRECSADARILADEEKKYVAERKSGKKRHASPLEQGMQVAKTAMESVPDVREDVVEEIKARITKGEYQVSGEEIAEMMIRRMNADKIR